MVNRFGIVSIFLCLALSTASSAATPPKKMENKGLFGSHEIISHQFVAFKKWNSMLERVKKDQQQNPAKNRAENQPCRKTPYEKCEVKTWRDLLDSLKDKPAGEQIAEINVQMNKARYITDLINWGVPDYWATIRQFLQKDGDCEDYAIAKYMSLKELGFDVDMMRIVVVQDTNLDIPHAVLVVSIDGNRWVLDNQISYVVKEKAVLHYRPLYSINENAWWLHRM